MYEQDTIAAIATPAGTGGIGIVRVSGPLAESIAELLVERWRNERWESHRIYPGVLVANGRVRIDRVLAVLMRRPHSYTGEDVLEVHCHGSPAVLCEALDAALHAGARLATAGEFTRRAFLNGKLDLVQAEAVADLTRARSTEQARVAADQLLGRLSERLNEVRTRVINVKAKLEAQIDFPEEELEIDTGAVLQELHAAIAGAQALLGTYRHGRLVREGLRVAIIGRPNVGKSSLLNALLGQERAIVTASPGTTRDVIEESADFEGVTVVLSDTAGLRDVAGEVERVGIERARRVAEAADVRLLVVDRSVPPEYPEEWFDVERTIAVLNKIDLASAWNDEDVKQLRQCLPVVEVSATEGLGLDELRSVVLEVVGGLPESGVPILSHVRQYDALRKACQSLRAAAAVLQQGLPPELVATEIQEALEHIGAVTGVVTTDEILDRIFAEFCVGK